MTGPGRSKQEFLVALLFVMLGGLLGSLVGMVLSELFIEYDQRCVAYVFGSGCYD